MKFSMQSCDKLIYIVRPQDRGRPLLVLLECTLCKYVVAFGINVGLFIHEELSLLDKAVMFKQGLKHNTQVCSMVSGVMLMHLLWSDTDHF